MTHADGLLSSYDYALPEARIAQIPCAERAGARLLVVPAGNGPFEDSQVQELPRILRAGDLLVFNDTRVRPARLEGSRRSTGGRAEFLVLEISGTDCSGLLKTRGTPQPGEVFDFGDMVLVHARDCGEGIHTLSLSAGADAAELLRRCGRMPLPPYIHRARGSDARDALDRERYQTVYARSEGAAAAPTAGLHFTPELLEQLSAAGVQRAFVTLHVGLGTFKPVTAERLEDHRMHEEAWTVPAETAAAITACRARGGRVIPVGTTSLRALESAALAGATPHAGSGRTRLFLKPGSRFACADLLFTNFHAPCSTLLALTAAWCGRERILAAYAHALDSGYRFLSYGDACLLHPADGVKSDSRSR